MDSHISFALVCGSNRSGLSRKARKNEEHGQGGGRIREVKLMEVEKGSRVREAARRRVVIKASCFWVNILWAIRKYVQGFC